MINADFKNYGTDSFTAEIEVSGRSCAIADQIALILREVSRGAAGWSRSTKSMMHRIYFQLKMLEDLGTSNTTEEDLELLNATRAFDIEKMSALEKKFAEPETGSEMTVKSENGSEMTVKQTGKSIEIKMTTKED